MDKQSLTGTITFIHHEKDYATIEYLHNGKTKSINGNISEQVQQKLKEKKLIKKTHAFRIGDEVSFVIVPTPRGDKMVADLIEFRYNNAYVNLLQKAATENRFVGYLFPLLLSPWELPPHDSHLNEPTFFKLNNFDKPASATAALYKSEFIPQYKTALQYFKNKTVCEGTVYKVTPFGIFINLFNNAIQAKIPLSKNKEDKPAGVKTGDMIKVLITYMSPLKIVVERVS